MLLFNVECIEHARNTQNTFRITYCMYFFLLLLVIVYLLLAYKLIVIHHRKYTIIGNVINLFMDWE